VSDEEEVVDGKGKLQVAEHTLGQEQAREEYPSSASGASTTTTGPTTTTASPDTSAANFDG